MATCSCITETAQNISNSVTDERVERSDIFDRKENRFGEMIIIVALTGISTVFFLIIISLLQSIKTLRRSIRCMKMCTLYKDSEEIAREQSLLTN